MLQERKKGDGGNIMFTDPELIKEIVLFALPIVFGGICFYYGWRSGFIHRLLRK